MTVFFFTSGALHGGTFDIFINVTGKRDISGSASIRKVEVVLWPLYGIRDTQLVLTRVISDINDIYILQRVIFITIKSEAIRVYTPQ